MVHLEVGIAAAARHSSVLRALMRKDVVDGGGDGGGVRHKPVNAFDLVLACLLDHTKHLKVT